MMENTNDKTASAATINTSNFCKLVEACRPFGDEGMRAHKQLVAHIDQHCATIAEEARREAAAEIAELRRKLRSLDDAYRDGYTEGRIYEQKVIQEVRAQRTAGGDAAGGGYVVGAAYSPASDQRGGMAGGDAVAKACAAAVASAMGQPADTDLEALCAKLESNRTPVAWRAWPDRQSGDITTSRATRELWAKNGVPFRAMAYINEAPVAEAAAQADGAPKYETMTDHNGKVIGVRLLNADRMPPYAAAPTAQPTPKENAPTLADRGVEEIPAQAVTSAEASVAQPTPPDDERAAFPERKPLLGWDEHTYEMPVDWDDGYVQGWNECVDAFRAALRQPGALPPAPRTRRDINVANLSPAIRALHDAFLAHDSAAMTLFARDDQVAWIAKDGMGNPKPVMVGQLREVLVAALGLPGGTKFGG